MKHAAVIALTAIAVAACGRDARLETDATGCQALPSVAFEDTNPGLDKTQLDYLMNIVAGRADCLREIERDLATQPGTETALQHGLFAAEASAAEAALERLKVWNPSWKRRSTQTLKL